MTRKERTRLVLAKFHGLRYEFDMLKGVLCSDHIYENSGDQLFDGMMIAKRMDEINNEAMKGYGL